MKSRKQDVIETKVTLLPDYGRKKLLSYAESFRGLAKIYDEEKEAEGVSENSIIPFVGRSELYLERCRKENREILSDHLQKLAEIMVEVAGETYGMLPFPEKKQKNLVRTLRMEGIEVKGVHFIKNEHGSTEVEKLCITLRQEKGQAVSSEDVAGMISVILNKRYLVSDDSPYFLSKEYEDFYFLQESRFHCMTGVACVPKETENVSGDNYIIQENAEGRVYMLLSDGMGSGKEACRDSSVVVDVMEQLLETGFKAETAIQIMNHAFFTGAGGRNIATMDYCEIDLHSGNCSFQKVGAAASYIKRDRMVEQISSSNLPLGSLKTLETDEVERELMDGDYIIMFSDGIMDSFSQGIGEEMLGEIISQIPYTNPTEIANYLLNYCLHQTKGRIRDDLTILVAGIWEN